jgi:putative spermidine/putrescine transport system substrate-binding protein
MSEIVGPKGSIARISRRTLLAGSAAAGTALAAPSIVRAQGAGRIVYACWGGSWEAAMRKAWAAPFTKETGIEVVTVGGNTLGRLQAMVEAGRTEWDVVEGLPDMARVGAEKNLLEPIDFSVVDRGNIMDRAELISPYSVPEVIFGRVMVYNKKFTDPPKTWADFWDTSRFPGKRTFYKRAEGGTLEVALLADGVPADKLYPLDIDRALKKLTAIRGEILWHDTPAHGEQFLSDGQAALGFLADGRAWNIKNNGAPVELQQSVNLLTWSVFVVPKGAPNKAGAMKFLSYVTSPKPQAAVAMEYPYGPIAPKAWEMIPPERRRILSGSPETSGSAVFQNADWWGKNLERATEKFQGWMIG